MAEITSETGRTRTEDERVFFDWRYVRGLKEHRRQYRMAFILFWSILMYLFFSHFVISVGIIRETSMVPTVPEDGYYLVNRYIYYVTRPKRGDIVVLRQNAHTPEILKRVVGLEGETLLIKGGHLEYWNDGWRHPLTANQAKALITKYAATAQVQVRYNQYASLGARQVKRAWLIGTKDTNRLLLPKVYEALRKDGWIGEEIGPRVAPMIYFKAKDLSDV